ncbi:MAG TPA: multidrug transporter [Rheinheimera sp.]|nr:multidrug transporter [Rheinheimera sp.]
MTWVFFTVLAAFMQAFRNAFQKKLSVSVPVMGVTLARFLFGAPLAALYLCGLYHWGDAPAAPAQLPTLFVLYAVAAALMQIVATSLMVKVFTFNNYAIGAGLAKSEAIFAAILGVMFFASSLTPLGWLGVLVGAVAVFLLSGLKSLRDLDGRTLIYGAGSGLSFALTSLWVREASLSLGLPFPYGAAWVLLLVLTIQTVTLLVYLALKSPETLQKMRLQPKLVLITSIASCVGSLGWFTAMSLQTVPLVKTLGQIEVLFTLLISVFWLKEKLKPQDLWGLALIVLAAVLVMWA